MPLPSDEFVWMTKGEQRAEVRNNASVPIMERQGWRVAGRDAPGTARVEAPVAASGPEAVAVAAPAEAARAPTWGKKGRK